MKAVYTICFFIFIALIPLCYPQTMTQGTTENEMRSDPLIFKVRSHEPNFKGFKNESLRQIYSSGESFYKQKDQWRHIIDSMWGPGLPTAQKLQIFDDYANHLHYVFDGFQSLGMSWASWDSLRAYWRSKITDSTSRGVFSGIMSRFAFSLRDIHTYAWDDTVVQTPLNPGVPILCIGGILDGSYDPMSPAHFGAVITPLPDSNLLVLKVVPSHPLNLQPGDIILGYEGFRWNTLVTELLNMDLPMYYFAAGAESALNHELLISAGMNWHLFDTIDVIKYANLDTLHLSLESMVGLTVPAMLNSEQLPVPGVPFPDYYNYQDVSYGTITGTNIGYIYLYIESVSGTGWPVPYADEEFFQAVDALKDKDALIIDLRFNQGGRAFFDAAFDILFNRSLQTLKSALRCNTFDQTLCPMDYHGYTFETTGKPPGFDRPIAVLLGPSCVSFGDITAYRLRTHDMARFFGKSSCGSLGWNQFIGSYPGWTIRYSVADQFNLSNPGVYLNRKEFSIDYPVWFNANDVANGIDPVVQRAVEWINNSSYTHDVKKDKVWYQPGNDTIKLTANVENPGDHPLSVTAYYRIGEEILDSSFFYDDGLHNDSIAGDGLWGTTWAIPNIQSYFNVNVSTYDPVTNEIFLLQHLTPFSTNGPIVIDSLFSVRVFKKTVDLDVWLKNEGSESAVLNIEGELLTSDSLIQTFLFKKLSYGTLEPGQIKQATFVFDIDTSLQYHDLNLVLNIEVGDIAYWSYPIIIPIRPDSGLSKNKIIIDSINNIRTSKSNVKIDLILKNEGLDNTFFNVEGSLYTADPIVKTYIFNNLSFGLIDPERRKGNTYIFKIDTSVQCKDLVMDFNIDVGDVTRWSYPITIPIRSAPLTSKDNIDFGILFSGVQKSDSIVLRNIYSLPLNLSTITSDNPSVYNVHPSSVIIPPMDSAKIYVEFNPTVYGKHDSKLMIVYVGGISPLQINMTGLYSPPGIEITVREWWNMISVPITANCYHKDSLFKTASSCAFKYRNGYEIADTLTGGSGYWLRFSSAEMVLVHGAMMLSETLDVKAGWNIIGSITNPISVSEIRSMTAGMTLSFLYRYNGTPEYGVADSIKPGEGYWVKVNIDGKLILSSTGQSFTSNSVRIVSTDEMPPPPPNSEIPNPKSQIPTTFALEQNYPNPFNPMTVIRYSLPDVGRDAVSTGRLSESSYFVTLKVYNVLGKEVATLVNEIKQPGNYSVSWNAENVPSGVYFYRLSACSFIETKKLILLR